MEKSLKFTIDFDNTCAVETYDGYGDDVVGAADVLRRLKEKGHRIILWTCRSRAQLRAAESWFEKHNIPLDAVNDFIYDDATIALCKDFGVPRKVLGDFCIDDKNLGTPMREQKDSKSESYHTVVDWKAIEKLLKDKNIL